jgi:dimethylamine monooxygenase subunit A
MVGTPASGRNRTASDHAPYLPFVGGQFRLTMGLMPLGEAEWLEIDGDLAAHLAEKRELLAARAAEIFAALPEAADGAAELLAFAAEHLPRHHPEFYAREGDQLFNRATGEAWDVAHPALHPLDLCGRLVQEDFCLLRRAGEAHVLVGASLAAPARWRLGDKIGRPLAALHAPVAGYAATLARPVDRFFLQLKPGRLVWRLNWGILDRPARFQPTRPAAPASIAPEAAGQSLWLRVERQTLRKLPRTETVLFTIRTHITRLDRAITSAATAADLAGMVRTMPADTRHYKDIESFAPALLAWLDARARDLRA